jgi:parallel beta-helix repeat protein
MENSSSKIIDNIISGNASEYDNGCAIYLSNSSALIKGNKIINNIKSSGTNCLYITGSKSNPRIINNIIAGNSGDAFDCTSSSGPIIINNTISDNSGDGIKLEAANADSIINNIISFNSGYGIEESSESENPRFINYNLFYINANGLFMDKDAVIYSTATALNSITGCKNNIDNDPMFVNKAAGDYLLLCISPAIDHGDNSFPCNLETPYTGNRIDIGAYGNTPEATPKCKPTLLPVDLYVNSISGKDSSDYGTASNTPWKTITYALSQITSGRHTVNVAHGNYTDEIFPIYMKDSVSLLGAGSNKSTIDAGGLNTVIMCIGISDTSTELSSFTIEGGGTVSDGVGIFISAGSLLKVMNNNITDNNPSSFMSGGGIYITNASPSILNNTIINNGTESYTEDGAGNLYV